jgi:hypothetical protein
MQRPRLALKSYLRCPRSPLPPPTASKPRQLLTVPLSPPLCRNSPPPPCLTRKCEYLWSLCVQGRDLAGAQGLGAC